MASRFGARDSRSALFEGYPSASSTSQQDARRPSPGRYGYGYGFPGAASSSSSPGFDGGGTGGLRYGSRNTPSPSGSGGLRTATPNKRGQYSAAVLNELESQNDAQVDGIMGKVRILKDMTVAIGDEIRDSSALAEKMNDSFDATRLRLRGTMNRMLVMAEKSGVSWKVWLGFFAAVILLFFYVWLF